MNAEASAAFSALRRVCSNLFGAYAPSLLLSREVLMRFALAALIAAIFLCCSLPAQAAATGVVSGTVRTTGGAAGGALVALSGENTTVTTKTDAAGNFSFPQVLFGHYKIAAHVTGLPDSTQEIDVASDTVTTVSLRLTTVKEIGRVSASSRGGGEWNPLYRKMLWDDRRSRPFRPTTALIRSCKPYPES